MAKYGKLIGLVLTLVIGASGAYFGVDLLALICEKCNAPVAVVAE